jgi:hypothetical protein
MYEEYKQMAIDTLSRLATYAEMLRRLQINLYHIRKTAWKSINLGYIPKNNSSKRYIKVDRPLMFPEWIRFFSDIARNNEIHSIFISNEEIRFTTRHKEIVVLSLIKPAVRDLVMFSFLDDYTWRRILNNVRNRDVELYKTVEYVYNICNGLRELLNKDEIINDNHGSVLYEHFRLNDGFVDIVSKIIELAFSGDDWASFVTGATEDEPSFSDVLLDQSIRLVPYIEYRVFYERRQCERELNLPRGITNIKDVRRLAEILIHDSAIELKLLQETGDSSYAEYFFYLVNYSSEVRIRDLILAHYMLTDEDWQWIYETVLYYLRLSEVAKKKIEDAYAMVKMME